MTLAALYAGAAACQAMARAATTAPDALLWERYSLELRNAAARLTVVRTPAPAPEPAPILPHGDDLALTLSLAEADAAAGLAALDALDAQIDATPTPPQRAEVDDDCPF